MAWKMCLIEIMMVLWFMTAVPTGIILICNYGSDANEVCVVGLKVGYITYSWSYCWFLQTKWFYCWFQSPISSRVTVRFVWLVYRLVI